MLLDKNKNSLNEIIHFVGIGGIGMSGIAEIMNNLGYHVQGSDIAENYSTERLRTHGIKVFSSHHAENITNAAYLVISSAINTDNAEVKAALEKKIPVIRRAEMLAELMRLKNSVAVSGSHGKTTTTSLIACMFESAGLKPTVINGGIINNRSTNAYVGTGNYLIAEADESDATFIHIPASVAVITNIDPEHMDYYQDFTTLVAAFRSFIINLPFYGFAVVCIDHPVVRNLVSDIHERKIITYGIDSADANIIAFNISSDIDSSVFDVKINLPGMKCTAVIEGITIPTPGRHNILNSLAAIAIGAELDFGIQTLKNGFRKFAGVKRRFTKVGEYNGASIIDDYAHHPVEIEATLSTARIIADKQGGRVIAIFQPHRYSRLKSLFDDFIHCFGKADLLYITDIYSAGEAEIEGISSTSLLENIEKSTTIKANYISSPKQIPIIIKDIVKSGDLIIMMGAGNITLWANKLADELANKSTSRLEN